MNRSYFHPFLTDYNRRQPTYNAPQRTNPQYNSSNAPATYNDRQVPMDVGWTKFKTWRGRGNGPGNNWRNQNRGGGRANVANTGPKGNNECFKCGQPGHYARNCPQNQGRNARANLIDFDQDEETLYEENTSRVSHICSELDAMTFTEKQQLAKELGQGEDQDFPAA
jgi:Zinc knuckle